MSEDIIPPKEPTADTVNLNEKIPTGDPYAGMREILQSVPPADLLYTAALIKTKERC